jgi:uncharacterized membrane protein YfcA
VTITTILVLILFCIGASIIQRITGFGFGIFIMTVLPFIMPSYGEATALSGLLAVVQSLLITIKYFKYISFKKLIPILITFIVISYFAISCMAILNDYFLKKVLGVILILVGLYFFFFDEKIHIKPTIPNQIGLGSISGFMGGFFGMQGPPAVLYFLSTANSKEQYLVLAQAYFLVGNIFMTIFRAEKGFVTMAVGQAWLIALVAIYIGSWIGAFFFNKISISLLKKISYTYMGISGIIALIV